MQHGTATAAFCWVEARLSPSPSLHASRLPPTPDCRPFTRGHRHLTPPATSHDKGRAPSPPWMRPIGPVEPIQLSLRLRFAPHGTVSASLCALATASVRLACSRPTFIVSCYYLFHLFALPFTALLRPPYYVTRHSQRRRHPQRHLPTPSRLPTHLHYPHLPTRPNHCSRVSSHCPS